MLNNEVLNEFDHENFQKKLSREIYLDLKDRKDNWIC